MVQVDFVLSYAFGATLAAASGRQLEKEETPFNNRYFVFLLLFLACLFAPSGMYLLWQFPDWQTMHVAKGRESIEPLLVAAIAVTNVTQGILGYWATFKLIKKKKYYLAHVHWMVVWLAFWFILVCGWDGTGWERFLYDSTSNGDRPWNHGAWSITGFLSGAVFKSLIAMGFFITPPFLYALIKWIREGSANDPSIPRENVPGPLKITAVSAVTMFGICPLLAIIAALIVMKINELSGSLPMSFIGGIPFFAFMAYFLMFRKRMPMHFIVRHLFGREKED